MRHSEEGREYGRSIKCESERASYHPAWSDHYKREGRDRARPPSDDDDEIGEGRERAFQSFIVDREKERTRDPASAAERRNKEMKDGRVSKSISGLLLNSRKGAMRGAHF